MTVTTSETIHSRKLEELVQQKNGRIDAQQEHLLGTNYRNIPRRT